jgi:HD-like signal output (HDOD) protein
MTTTASPTEAGPLTPAQASALRALGASAGGASAARLLALLYDPDVDAERILSCLHGEPALAARVLKVANSPYYGQSGRVGSVQRAVQLLGLKAIRGIAAAGALDRVTPARAGTCFDPVKFRRHSGAVACAAQALSAKAGCGIDGEAFMAGLLHDIGMLLLVKTDPAAMAAFDCQAELPPAQARLAEEAHFGLSHEAAGAIMVESWALPAWLKQALCTHHAPLGAPLARQGLDALPALLQLADRLASAAGFKLWARCGDGEPEVLGAHFGLSAPDLQAVAQALPAAVDALALGA